MASGTIGPAPNSSIPMIVQAIGVLVAPANTATNPIAANSGTGAPTARPNAAPDVAPMTNRGVTSPPWNPDPRVTDVKSSLSAKAPATMPAPPASEAVMSGTDRPR